MKVKNLHFIMIIFIFFEAFLDLYINYYCTLCVLSLFYFVKKKETPAEPAPEEDKKDEKTNENGDKDKVCVYM